MRPSVWCPGIRERAFNAISTIRRPSNFTSVLAFWPDCHPASRWSCSSSLAISNSRYGAAIGVGCGCRCRRSSLIWNPLTRSTSNTSSSAPPRSGNTIAVSANPHPRRGEDEQDERDEDRDDVRVQDRREALLVARGDRRAHTPARAHLLLDAFEDHDVRVGRHPEREDQARDPRQRQHDRDQLDDRVEVEARRWPCATDGDHAQHAVEDRAGRARRSRSPRRPRCRPWSSACWPSVAETCEREISSSRIGSAPILRIFARSCAESIVKQPEICAPVEPSMPSGFSR